MGIRKKFTAIVLVAGIGVGLAGCAQAEAAGREQASLGGSVSKVEPIAGTALNRVLLTPEAAGRLGIETGAVSLQAVTKETVVPYSAVIYDASGASFVYTVPQPNTFVRSPVTVTDVSGDVAAITTVLPTGTPVVTVGVSELLGTETGVGDE